MIVAFTGSLLENNPDAGDRVCPIFDHSSARVLASYVADQHVCRYELLNSMMKRLNGEPLEILNR